MSSSFSSKATRSFFRMMLLLDAPMTRMSTDGLSLKMEMKLSWTALKLIVFRLASINLMPVHSAAPHSA